MEKAKLRGALTALSLIALLASCGGAKAKTAAPAPTRDPYGEAGPEVAESFTDPAAWKLVWSDEFDGPELDAAKWNYSEGATGWGNSELQEYTNLKVNARTEGGNLVIQALRDPKARNGYSSARINTKRKYQFAYGRVEARLRIPQAPHIWPCLWLLGDTNGKTWPNCGEIDIAEVSGTKPRTVGGALHGPGYSGGRFLGGETTIPYSLGKTYHVASLEWDRDEIRWYFDGQLFKTVNKADIPAEGSWAFDHPFYFILNLAVGGNLAEYPTSSSAFPQTMYVDYIRVYEKK